MSRTITINSSSTGQLALIVDRLVADAGPFGKVSLDIVKHENRPVKVVVLDSREDLIEKARSIR